MTGSGTRLSAEDEARIGPDLAERYRSGLSLRRVAAQVGMSYALTRRLILDQGVSPRRVQARPKAEPRPRGLTAREAHELGSHLAVGYTAGATVRLLAEINGLTYGTVYRLLRAQGVQLRPRGGPGNRQRKAALQTHATTGPPTDAA
jgi:transposase